MERGLEVNGSAEAVSSAAWIPSHLQITVFQGRNLALKSKNVNSEVYVNVQLDREKVTTPLLPRHTHPIWNQKFEFALMSFQSVLELQVRQKSKFTDDYIGQIRIPVTNLILSKQVRKTWYKLASRPGKTSSKIRGDIFIGTCFLSKWDSKESKTANSIDLELPEQPTASKMLRRTKSEHRSKSSPKPDKSKQKSVFDRLRKNKTNVFEECEDFVVSVRTPESPPTPVNLDRKKLFSSSASDLDNGEQLSTSPSTNSDFKGMFTEAAAQMEKCGVLDLSRVDTVTRVERGRQMFEALRNNSSQDNEEEDNAMSSITRTYSFRHKRPLRSQSLSIKTFDQSPNSSHHLQKSLSTMTTSTPISTTPPRSSPAVTYRATSMKRKGKRLNSNSGNVLHQGSTVSMDSDSATSEYYSSTSLSENPSKSFSVSSVSEDQGKHTDTQKSVEEEELEDTKDKSEVPNIMSTSVSMVVSETDDDGVVSLSQQTDFDSTTNNSHDNYLEPPLLKGAARREMSVPTETQTLERDEVRLRKNRKRFASETMDYKRHSADIESLLRLTAHQQGKHDGLGNVLSTQQIKMKLNRRSTLESGQTVSLSQPSSEQLLPVARSANSTPLPTVPISHKYLGQSHDAIPNLISPTNSNFDSDKELVNHSQTKTPAHNESSLPSIKRSYHQENLSVESNQPPALSLDKAALFESYESSSTATSLLYPPSSVCTSLDSSFSSDYASLSNNKRVDDDNPSDSQCTTPTSMTPTATREATPSPELPTTTTTTTVSAKTIQKEQKTSDESGKKARNSFNKPSSDFSKVNMPPLPPSLKYSTLPTRGKFAGSSNVTELVSAAMKIISPNETTKDLVHPPNTRLTKFPVYSLSASNSGRTSPVIEENEEENEQKVNESTELLNPVVKDDKLLQPNISDAKKDPSTGTPPSQGNKLTRTSSNYESSSLQRRRLGGSGLKKAISLYHDNRRQTAGARRALFRDNSVASASEKGKTKNRETGLLTDGSNTSTKETLSTITIERLKEHDKKSDSQMNGFISGAHAVASGGQFNLPPPPEISHTAVAEQVCSSGVNRHHQVETQEALNTVKDSYRGEKEPAWKSSQSTLGSCSADEIEELCEADLHSLSKQALIDLVLETNKKLIKSKSRLDDTQLYLDSLLLKVMERSPELLQGAGTS